MRTYGQLLAIAKEITTKYPWVRHIQMTPPEVLMVFEVLSSKPLTPKDADDVIRTVAKGTCKFLQLTVVATRNPVEPIGVGSLRKDHDWDMELVGDYWDVATNYLCQRCQRRYRVGHHDIYKCRKMFSDEVAAKMQVWRY